MISQLAKPMDTATTKGTSPDAVVLCSDTDLDLGRTFRLELPKQLQSGRVHHWQAADQVFEDFSTRRGLLTRRQKNGRCTNDPY